MVEVIGKTIGQLNEVKQLDDDFMFLGCQGIETSYSTWKTTYNTLKADLSSVFMNSLGSDIEKRLDKIENNINNGNGSLYLKKDSDYEENINSEVRFKNTLIFNDSTQFYCGNDRQSNSEYKVILPKNTYKDPNGNSSNNFTCNDSTRVATNQDIINAINNFRQEMQIRPKQIMDINYQLYKDNGVAIRPYYRNTNYIYDSASTEPNTFYRYAGIKTLQNGTNESAKSDSIVFKNISGKYAGIPLTESYKNFRTLTIYTSTTIVETNANEAERIYAINISVNDLNIARQYKDYKAQYKHKIDGARYFENIRDRFYLGDAYDGEIYLDLKVSATFTDTFIPITTRSSNMIIIAVFGNN